MKKIVAHFQLGEIVEGHPKYLWEQFRNVSGIEEEDFFQYFAGKDTGFAIQIEELMQYERPIDPKALFKNFVPPQSFCYVDYLTNQEDLLKIKS
jgi:type I restriction enzyme S subunit